MSDIEEFFISILNECGSIDIAESEFKHRIAEEEDLKARYQEWCDETGYSYRRGFLDFCEEYLDSQNNLFDTLNDDDE